MFHIRPTFMERGTFQSCTQNFNFLIVFAVKIMVINSYGEVD